MTLQAIIEESKKLTKEQKPKQIMQYAIILTIRLEIKTFR